MRKVRTNSHLHLNKAWLSLGRFSQNSQPLNKRLRSHSAQSFLQNRWKIHIGQNFTYAHTQSMASTATVFSKLKNYSMPVTWGSVRSSSKSAKKYIKYGQKLTHALSSWITATEPIFTKLLKFPKLLVKKEISGDKIFTKHLKQFVRSMSAMYYVQYKYVSHGEKFSTPPTYWAGSSTDIRTVL